MSPQRPLRSRSSRGVEPLAPSAPCDRTGAAKCAINGGQIELLGSEVRADPFSQLRVALVGRVRYGLEQLFVGVGASRVLWRTRTAASQALRLRCTALRGFFVLDDDL